MNDINVPHYITVGIFALFPGLRRFIGILGLVGLIVGGWMAYSAYYFPQVVAVNATPTCDREIWMPQSAFLPPQKWGEYVKSVPEGAKQPTYYVRERNGSGWCMVKHDPAIVEVNGMYANHWTEVPTKYGSNVQVIDLAQNKRMSPHEWLILGILGFSVVILLGIWLPATIFAAVGRRFLKDVKEEPL